MDIELFGSMGPENYIKERVDQYQSWYDKKAVNCKSAYLKMKISTVIGGAIVPALTNWDIPSSKIIVTIISLLVVILVSLESILHYREQWKNYRSTEQYLGREKFYFLTKEGPYKNLAVQAAFILFVERVEAAIADENSATLNILTKAAETKEEKGKSSINM